LTVYLPGNADKQRFIYLNGAGAASGPIKKAAKISGS
jgi:hypothetical protein